MSASAKLSINSAKKQSRRMLSEAEAWIATRLRHC